MNDLFCIENIKWQNVSCLSIQIRMAYHFCIADLLNKNIFLPHFYQNIRPMSPSHASADGAGRKGRVASDLTSEWSRVIT